MSLRLSILALASESCSNFVTVPDLIQSMVKVVFTEDRESKIIMNNCP